MVDESEIESSLEEISKKLVFHDLLVKLDRVLYSDLFIKLCDAYLHPKLAEEVELPMEIPLKVSAARIYTESTVQLLIVSAVNGAEAKDGKLSIILKMFIDARLSSYDEISPFIAHVKSLDVNRLQFFISTFVHIVKDFKLCSRSYILFDLLSFKPSMLKMDNVIERKEDTNASIIAGDDGKFAILNGKMVSRLTDRGIVRSDEMLGEELSQFIKSLVYHDETRDLVEIDTRNGRMEVSNHVTQSIIDGLESYGFTTTSNRCRFEINRGKEVNCYTSVFGFTKMNFDLDVLVRLANVVDLENEIEKVTVHGKNMLFFKIKEKDLYFVITFQGINKKGDGAIKEEEVLPDTTR